MEIRILDYSIRVYPDYDEPAAPRVALGTSRANSNASPRQAAPWAPCSSAPTSL